MGDIPTIYHNPRCSKSRQTLQLMRDNNVEPKIVEYLKEMPSKKELKLILAKLHLNVIDVVRKEEAVYKEKFKGQSFNDDEWLTIIEEYPKLLQRPIVIKGNTGIIGRPPENVIDLLK